MKINHARRREHRALTVCVSSALLVAAVPALAQTCANPIPLVDGQTHAYTTCGAPNSLPYLGAGVFDSPQNDVVYRIHTAGAPTGSFQFAGLPWGLMGVIMSQCSLNATLAAAYDPVSEGPVFPLPPLPAGDNFLVVTADPNSASNTCGAYQVTAHITDPVPPPRGSCASPITYTSGTNVSGNTCTATNTLPSIAAGAFDSPQNDLA
ncbi:MAG: hypothetical protein ABIR62_13365, partial [Dokdonella sp.]|uniref:hypothetical protein n=1 Tax=Dokdonella sp. TaxID=2291710 RepID=UPI003263FF05